MVFTVGDEIAMALELVTGIGQRGGQHRLGISGADLQAVGVQTFMEVAATGLGLLGVEQALKQTQFDCERIMR